MECLTVSVLKFLVSLRDFFLKHPETTSIFCRVYLFTVPLQEFHRPLVEKRRRNTSVIDLNLAFVTSAIVTPQHIHQTGHQPELPYSETLHSV